MFFDSETYKEKANNLTTLCIMYRGYWQQDVLNKIIALRKSFKKMLVASFDYDEVIATFCSSFDVKYLSGIKDERLDVLYNAVLREVEDSWAFIISDDEKPSLSLVADLESKIIPEMEKTATGVGKVNYKQELDGIITSSDFYAEKIFCKQGGGEFFGKTHLIYVENVPRYYLEDTYYIIHSKSVNKLLWGLVWGAFLNPRGHNSEAMEVIFNRLDINGLKQFRMQIQKGFDEETERYIMYMYQEDICIKALVWLYFFVLHRDRMEKALKFYKEYLDFVSITYKGETLCLES